MCVDSNGDRGSPSVQPGELIIYLSLLLFGIVQKAGRISELKKELLAGLAAVTTATGIELDEVLSHFISTVTRFVNTILSVEAFREAAAGLSLIAYLINKMYNSGVLRVGVIHQASMEELPNWVEFIEQAKWTRDITVN